MFLWNKTDDKYRGIIILKLDLSRETGALLTWVQKNKHLFN